MPGQYVWINGMPGVGKLTVARALQSLLVSSQHPARLIDNHSIIDQVKLPRSHADYNTERQRVRDAVYDSVVHPDSDAASACGSKEEQMAEVIIFTDFFTAGTIGSEWSRAHQTAAIKGHRSFLPIYLVCEREENLKRVVRPERGEKGSTKLTNVELVRKFMDDSVIFTFPGLGVEIDTTSRTPEKTAGLIYEAMQAQLQEQKQQSS